MKITAKKKLQKRRVSYPYTTLLATSYYKSNLQAKCYSHIIKYTHTGKQEKTVHQIRFMGSMKSQLCPFRDRVTFESLTEPGSNPPWQVPCPIGGTFNQKSPEPMIGHCTDLKSSPRYHSKIELVVHLIDSITCSCRGSGTRRTRKYL